MREKLISLQKRSHADREELKRWVKDMQKLTLKMILFAVTAEIIAALCIILLVRK